MCGIIAYIGQNNAINQAINGLKKLEYRGYDSSGIAYLESNKIKTIKAVGDIKNLEQKTQKSNIKTSTIIAHTRWATHGNVTLCNAHPHTDNSDTFSVVHNGIIENYQQLKCSLTKTKFYSQTDTEVLPNLFYLSPKTSTIEKMIDACKLIKGSFSIALIDKNSPNTLYFAKRQSPLYIAYNQTEVLASSDPICFDGKFENYFTMSDNEFCVAKPGLVEFFDKNNKKIKKTPTKLGEFEKSCLLKNHKYFAEKEVSETPAIIKKIMCNYKAQNYFKKIDKKYLENISQIHIIGCGTAYHAALMGCEYIFKNTKIPSHAYIASEYRYNSPKINQNTLCIFMSQSGETADTILCLKKAKYKKAKIISVVNVPYSSIAKQSDITLPCCAGAEIAVISTKAYCSMLFVLFLLAKHLKNIIKQKNNNIFACIDELKNKKILPTKKQCQTLLNFVNKFEKVIFIGKASDYITAQEASLKLKEISYINCIAIPSGELKHGSLALVDEKTVVIAVATKRNTLEKTLASASEIKARKGSVILLTNLDIPESCKKDVDLLFEFEKCSQQLSDMLCIVPLQTLAIDVCISKNLSPDKPRNLAKSVTVE